MALLPFSVYIQEIVDFLKTVTIKFDPFIEQIDNYYLRYYNEPIVENEKKKYYLNLVGEYHKFDTIMKVWSIDTNEEVTFNKQLFIDHPKTGALYKIPSDEHNRLCLKYPLQVDLIKNIIYPACEGNIDQVIDAKNLTLLSYDINLLHQNERESLIVALMDFLAYIEDRWFFSNYYFENLYYPAFWGMLWPNIALILIVQRILNIKTNAAHPFHIWEHLTSNGIGDYRTILTDKQALYLYRNIEYILRNRGKMTNLYLLTENLLKDHYISLMSKLMYQGIDVRAFECVTSPEIINQKIVDYRYNPSDTDNFSSLLDFQYRLYNEKLETRIDADYLYDTETRLGINKYNVLQTKYLELKKDPIFTSFLGLLGEFLLDTVMYKYATNKLVYDIPIKDPLTITKLQLSIPDLIIFLHYAVNKAVGETPVYIPNKYITRIPYKSVKPDLSELPEKINIHDVFFKIKNEVDIEQILNDIVWNNDVITSHEELGTLLSKQFDTIVKHITSIQLSASTSYILSMATLYDQLVAHEIYQLDLTNLTTYEAWFNSSEELSSIYTAYKDLGVYSKDQWDKLANHLLDSLLPSNLTSFLQYSGYIIEPDRLYEGLKELLIQLSSINVTYLDTSRSMRFYITLRFLTVVFGITEHFDKLYINYNRSIKYDMTLKTFAFQTLTRYISYLDRKETLYDKEWLLHLIDYDEKSTSVQLKETLPVTIKHTLNNIYHKFITPVNWGINIDISNYEEG